MPASNPVTGIQARTDNDALGDRRDRTVSWAHDSNAKLTSGVIPGYGSEFAITVNTSAMQVTVGNGAAMLGAPNGAAGGWPCVWLSDVLSIAARDATNPRIDLIIARVADSFYYANGDNLAAVELVTGAAQATPIAPTPALSEGSYLVLGQLTVPSAANGGTITLSNATAWTQVPRAVHAGQQKKTWTVTLSQTNAITMATPMAQPAYNFSGAQLLGTGTVKTQTTHSGGGGRPTINLPVPYVGTVDSFSMVGYYELRCSGTNPYRTFHGPLVTYGTASKAVLMDGTYGVAVTDGSNFDIPAGSVLTFSLQYWVA